MGSGLRPWGFSHPLLHLKAENAFVSFREQNVGVLDLVSVGSQVMFGTQKPWRMKMLSSPELHLQGSLQIAQTLNFANFRRNSGFF